ncbi:CAAX amino terminal protease self- immunity [Rubripirellula lacrimiformis]|uniref:CAAX amino terminal protease self-immunity n=1 Tax=Rubripirellula lacrimiformis TaxID=1930273 RepID=A0A517NFE9_9BACT|nr:type II CAAX endopeptidase family protein [Rubripirellula lacrimiformis]QDT05856.1 CAAX amino terminal protease self- immunity [Rubripirellula lacrimiformis]
MENPPALLILLNLLLLYVMVVSFVKWIRLLIAHRSNLAGIPEYLVPAQPRVKPFWNPGDALVMFGLMQVIAGLSIASMMAAGWVTRATADAPATGTTYLIVVTLGSGVVAAILALAWLRLRERRFVDLLSLRLSDADGLLGLKASLMILPPVLLVAAAASLLIDYEHPVLDSMAGMSPMKFAMIFIGTAIITPFTEELLFRVLLQGGLERLANPITDPDTGWRSRSWWPIVVTSIVFAMAHLGQGAAPIPLFVLSLGLGFLYRQTGNITAPMIVHMVLNGSTIVLEGIKAMSS